MLYDNTIAGLLQTQRSYLEAVVNNRGRVARVTATWTTQGAGEIRVSVAFPFDVVFIEEPSFTTGAALADDNQLKDGHFPRISSGVYTWRKDHKGYYTGAYVYFVVDVPGSDSLTTEAAKNDLEQAKRSGANADVIAALTVKAADVRPNYEIHHHLRWEGTAIKTLPDHLLDF